MTQQFYGTTGKAAVDSNGDCVVSHGLGVKPTAVIVTPGGPGQQATVDPDKITDTAFTVRFLWRDGTRFKSGTVIKYNVMFTYEPQEAAKWISNEKLGSYNFDTTVQVNNNMWNAAAGPQTITAYDWNRWFVMSDQPGTGDNDGVKTYPDTQMHVGISMADVPNINTSWKVATPSAGGVGTGKGKQWNAAYDIWLNGFKSEIMVWTNWNANWQYWYNKYVGEQVTLDGVEYYVYHKPASGTSASGIWFIRKAGTNEGSMNLKPLLDWSKNKGWLAATDKLEHIEYGFEIMYTGEPTRFDLLDFQVNIG